jgi:uncharacterized MnhB-related membrane protein
MLHALIVVVCFLFAIQAFRAKRLIASALWLAGVSALLSVLFFLLGAREVAVIELSVGAGLVTVLFIFAINISGEADLEESSVVPKPIAWGVVLLAVFLLGWFVLPEVVSHNPGVLSSGGTSLTQVLWQQRELDMFVQVVLIFAGVLGMLGLLAESKAPLDGAMAEEIAAERDRELLAMTQQSAATEEEGL